MNKQTIIFEVNEQTLAFVSGDQNYASNTVDYVEAVFRLGENWDFDVIVAVWQSKTQKIATVLGDGVCIVPTEVLAETGVVKVNLAGSDIVDDEVKERLTTYPEFALLVDATAQTSGTETQPITPSQFEQFVGITAENADRAETAKEQAQGYAEDASEAKEQAQGFAEDAEDYKDSASESATQAGEYKDEAKDYAEQAEEDAQEIRNMTATATTLPAGSSATANYSDGFLTLGIPRGDTGATGATGNGIASAVLNADYTLTLNFTDGTHYTTPPIRGAQGVQGETGNGIESVYLTATHGAVKTYTILFTDGTTTTFDVTDGEVTLAELASVLPTDTASGSIASFEDGSDLFDYLSCVVNIEPIQAGSGTPSPDNVRPITGWPGCEVDVAGKNLFDKSVAVIGERYNASGTTSVANTRARSALIRVKPSTAYYFTDVIAGGDYSAVWWYDKDENNVGYNSIAGSAGTPVSGGFTSPATAYYVGVNFLTSTIDSVQVEEGSTATPYTPYQGTTYPVSWQTEAGTVYGGYLTIAIVDGEPKTWVTAGRKYAVINDPDKWTVTTGTTDFRYTHSFSDRKTFSTSTEGFICSCFPVGNSENNVRWRGASDFTFGIVSTSLTLEQVKTLTESGNFVICYELATPQTYQLDPVQVACLLGQNNVWADCGDIEEVKYKADVQKWVEKQLREINTAILALS